MKSGSRNEISGSGCGAERRTTGASILADLTDMQGVDGTVKAVRYTGGALGEVTELVHAAKPHGQETHSKR
jgi:hypothetical protein